MVDVQDWADLIHDAALGDDDRQNHLAELLSQMERDLADARARLAVAERNIYAALNPNA